MFSGGITGVKNVSNKRQHVKLSVNAKSTLYGFMHLVYLGKPH